MTNKSDRKSRKKSHKLPPHPTPRTAPDSWEEDCKKLIDGPDPFDAFTMYNTGRKADDL